MCNRPLWKALRKGLVLQQDNEPKHTSKLWHNYLKTKESWRSRTVLYSHLNSAPFNIYGALEDGESQAICDITRSFVEHWDHAEITWVSKVCAKTSIHAARVHAIIKAKGTHQISRYLEIHLSLCNIGQCPQSAIKHLWLMLIILLFSLRKRRKTGGK